MALEAGGSADDGPSVMGIREKRCLSLEVTMVRSSAKVTCRDFMVLVWSLGGGC